MFRTMLTVLLFVSWVSAGVTAKPTLALWNLNTLGTEDRVSQVKQEIREALQRINEFALLSEQQVKERFTKAQIKDSTPIVKVVAALEADRVIVGTLGGLGEEISIQLKLLDGQTALELGRVASTLPLEKTARQAVLDEILIRLLLPKNWVGSLNLEVSENGARVFLDGNLVATTPLQRPILGIVPGKHILRITKDGFGEFSGFVTIRYADPLRMKVDLASDTVMGMIYEKESRAHNQMPIKEPLSPEIKSQTYPVGPSRTFLTVASWSFLGAGAGLLGAGLGLGLSEDWDSTPTLLCGSGAALLVGAVTLFLVEYSTDEVAGPPSDQPVTLLPTALPSGLGIALNGHF